MSFGQAMSRKIGKYEILGELGKGGFGSVFRAFDPTVGRVVALKVLTPSDDPTILNRFRIEAKAAGNLHHKNIVTIHDFGDHDGHPYLVMEFLEGEDLQKAMARGRCLTLIEKLHIMVQVADGLHCAHKNGIIHRDVKPANVMLLPDNTVKIMDFGIARMMDADVSRQTQTGMLVGTILYISPEQLQGWDGNVLADVWAYGVICYELLTGTNPFRAPDTATVMYKITYADPEPIQTLAPECPEALANVVARALSKDRESRYQNLEDLKYDIEPILVDLEKRLAEELLSQVNRLFDQGNLEEAQTVVRRILNLDPANRSARQLRESIQKKLQRQSVRPRVEKLLNSGDEEFGHRNFEAALKAYDAALILDQNDTMVRARSDRARDAIEQSKKALELLKNARKELQQHNLTNAFRYASEAARTDPTEPQAADLLKVIEGEIERRARERALQEGISNAKGLILIDSFDEAIAVLSGLASSYPESTLAAELLSQARVESVERAKRERLQRDLDTAKTLVKKGHFSEAVDLLKPLPEQFPNNAEASRLLSYAEDELTAQRRRESINKIHQQAQVLLNSDQLDASIRMLEEGLTMYSAEGSLVRLLESAFAKKAARERERAIRDVETRCEQLERDGRIHEALQSVERAVREYPGDSVLVAIRDRLQKDWEQYQRTEAIRSVLVKADAFVAAGKPADALDVLERSRFHYQDSKELRSAHDRAARLTEDQREQQFIEAQIVRAKDLEERQDFQSAVDVIDGALEQYPAAVELKTARERVNAAAQAFERNQALANQRRDIERMIDIGCYTDAAASIEIARKTFPKAAIFRELSTRVQHAVEAEQKKIDIAGRIREIQKAIDAGDLKQAVQFIKSAQQSFPNESVFGQLYEGAKRRFEESRAVERKQDADRRVKEIERTLVDGDFCGALKLIDVAQQIHAGDPVFAKLLEEAKRTEQQALAERTRQEIAQRKVGIDRALADGDFQQALDLIDAARRAHAAEAVFLHLLDDAKRAQADHQAAETGKDVAARRVSIAKAIADKDYRQSLALITAAKQAHPKELVFGQLYDEAVRAQDQALAAQRKQEVDRANLNIEQAIAAQDIPRASELISAARREYPDQAVFNALLEKLNALVKQKDLEAAITAVETSIESQEFERAKDLLARAMKSYPKENRFRQLGPILEKAAKYNACINAARRDLEEHRFPAAEKSVREALKQKPDDSDASALLKRIESERFQAEEGKVYKLAQREIDKLLEQRHFDLAAEKLQQVLVRFPRDPDLEKKLQLALARREELEKQRRIPNHPREETVGEAETIALRVPHSGSGTQAAAAAAAEPAPASDESGPTMIWAGLGRIKWVAGVIFVAVLIGGTLWTYEKQAVERARKIEIAKLTEQARIVREKLKELKQKEEESSRQRAGNNQQDEAQRKALERDQEKARNEKKEIDRKLAELKRLDQEKAQRGQAKKRADQERSERAQAKLDREKADQEKRDQAKRDQAQLEQEKQKIQQDKQKTEPVVLGPYKGKPKGDISWSGELPPGHKLTIDAKGSNLGTVTGSTWPRTEVAVDVDSSLVKVISSSPQALELENKTNEPIRRLAIHWTVKNMNIQ